MNEEKEVPTKREDEASRSQLLGNVFAVILIAFMLYAIFDNMNGPPMAATVGEAVSSNENSTTFLGSLSKGALFLDVIDHSILSPFVYLWALNTIAKSFGREIAYSLAYSLRSWIVMIVIVTALGIPVGRPFVMFVITRTVAVKVGDGLAEVERKFVQDAQENND